MVRLVWLPGHGGIAGNCKADELVRKDTSAPISLEWERVRTPLPSSVLLLDSWASWELDQWATPMGFGVARSFRPKLEHKRFSEPFALSKLSLSLVTGVLTGHLPIGVHAIRSS